MTNNTQNQTPAPVTLSEIAEHNYKVAEFRRDWIVREETKNAALVARVAELEAAIQWAIDNTGPHQQLLRVVGKNTFPALAKESGK